MAGSSYGSTFLLPLIGGSGGGGGTGGQNFAGAGGGGGGGAILIAASGTVNIPLYYEPGGGPYPNSGSILADGGGGGQSSGAGCGNDGGGGSGGDIRIIATTITGNGSISANGASGGGSCTGAGAGGTGRVRLEAENMQRTSGTSPAFTFAAPGPITVTNSPTLLITSVAGVHAPATPTGSADIVLPANTPNPVTVTFYTTGIPVGNAVTLTITPATGPAITVVSPALTGSTQTATASVQVNLPSGPSTLSATTTFTVTTAMGDSLSRFAKGERVDKVTLVAKLGAPRTAILTTVSGKKYEIAATLLPAGS